MEDRSRGIRRREGALAVITKHEVRGLLKANLFFRFDTTESPRPVWEPFGCVEAMFGANDLDEAARYLESAIRMWPATES